MTQILNNKDWIRRQGKGLAPEIVLQVKELGPEDMRIFARLFSSLKYRHKNKIIEGERTLDGIAGMLLTRIKSGKYIK